MLQHLLHTNKMVVENFLRHIKKLEKGRIGNGIVDIASRFPPDNDVARAQNRKLLGDIRLFNLQDLAELIHTLLAVAEAVQNPDTDRVRERLEEFRFEISKLLRHGIIYMHTLICEYVNVKRLHGIECQFHARPQARAWPRGVMIATNEEIYH